MKKERIKSELTRFFLYTIFFALFFSGFTLYRRILLHLYSIPFVPYGFGIIESMILAKVTLLGEWLKLGERFYNRSLIIPTLYKAILFSILVLLFSILEHFVTGFFDGSSFEKLFTELWEGHLNEELVKTYVTFFVFVLFFAFLEIGRVIGNEKLFNLFFRRHKDTES